MTTLGAAHLGPQERGDLLDRVAHGREEAHLEPELGQPARQPGRVRVLDVAEDDLVADREDDGGRRQASCARV